MKKRLKRVAPMQLAKILAIIYAILPLVMAPFFLLFSFIASSAAPAGQSAAPLPMLLGMGVGFFIFAPMLYGVIGFVCGLIGAFLYNLVASWVGGIEVEVE
ncbi:hypothetical protein [Pelagicoccus sp. SDUM812003]|uniref:hypothetical protein n=1 Tax=Pelagicoccus sp. SDUM812003 TaxID=3041267 RepID=UPI00280E1A3D|nr:hypothetical protein [Pelagicoccus sp. SDUM812003]MDQ8201774.1 hypothetical protein [Pelagicoccus sp. SDUM812003]